MWCVYQPCIGVALMCCLVLFRFHSFRVFVLEYVVHASFKARDSSASCTVVLACFIAVLTPTTPGASFLMHACFDIQTGRTVSSCSLLSSRNASAHLCPYFTLSLRQCFSDKHHHNRFSAHLLMATQVCMIALRTDFPAPILCQRQPSVFSHVPACVSSKSILSEDQPFIQLSVVHSRTVQIVFCWCSWSAW